MTHTMGTPMNRGPNLNLALGTISFVICFAVWGLISAFAATFRAEFHLTAKSTALLVAVPVLLGALARLPLGMLTDRLAVEACSRPCWSSRRLPLRLFHRRILSRC